MGESGVKGQNRPKQMAKHNTEKEINREERQKASGLRQNPRKIEKVFYPISRIQLGRSNSCHVELKNSYINS